MTKDNLNKLIDAIIQDLAENESVSLAEFEHLFNQIEMARKELNESFNDIDDLFNLE